jgi:hypothetical protein
MPHAKGPLGAVPRRFKRQCQLTAFGLFRKRGPLALGAGTQMVHPAGEHHVRKCAVVEAGEEQRD